MEVEGFAEKIPPEVVVQVSSRRGPPLRARGAILHALPTATPADVSALVDTITIPAAGPGGDQQLPLIDHLDLSNTDGSCLELLISQASLLGPYWLLRCLTLSNCHLTLDHVSLLTVMSARNFVWNLERLDMSNNPGIGLDLHTDTDTDTPAMLRPPHAFTTPNILMLSKLWYNAPLRHVDLSGTSMSSSALVLCLHFLWSELAESGDGTKANLESLRVGPPGEGTWSAKLVDELSSLVRECPRLYLLELVGGFLDEEAIDVLGKGTAVQSRKDGNGTTVVRFYIAERAAAVAREEQEEEEEEEEVEVEVHGDDGGGSSGAAQVVLDSEKGEDEEEGEDDDSDDDNDCEAEMKSLFEISPFTATAVGGFIPKFKIPDGSLDDDSKLWRLFEKKARANNKAIKDDKDRRMAAGALVGWQGAANGWDIRRWQNPSKNQIDEPHMLGSLNLLMDLWDKHGLKLEVEFKGGLVEFPFPARVPGGGREAFDIESIR